MSPRAFLYAFEWDGPTPRTHRSAQGDAGQHPAEEPTRSAPERHLEHPDGLTVFQRRLQDGARGNCLEAAGIALAIWQVAGLVELKNRRASGEARGGRGLGKALEGRWEALDRLTTEPKSRTTYEG